MAGISVTLEGDNIQLAFLKDEQSTAVVMDPHAARSLVRAVSQLLAELEEWGVVEQVADPDDGRAKLVRFTAKGEKGVLRGLLVLGQLERELTDKIGKRRMQELHTALLALEKALDH